MNSHRQVTKVRGSNYIQYRFRYWVTDVTECSYYEIRFDLWAFRHHEGRDFVARELVKVRAWLITAVLRSRRAHV
jgi:hypothetical protein